MSPMSSPTRTQAPTPDEPLILDGRPGWPMPDCAWDPCYPNSDHHGWLPWAIIRGDDWYTGLYSCDKGHAWTCGYSLLIRHEDPDLAQLKISPHRIVPSDAYFREHTNPPRPIQIELIDWSPLFRT